MKIILILLSSIYFCGCATGLNPEKKDFGLRKLWIKSTTQKVNLGYRKINRMSPLLVGSNIIQGNAFDGLKSFDRTTGNVNWYIPVANGVEAGVVVIKDRLFFGGNDGQFYSASVSTGDIIWTFPTRSETLSVPVIDEGIVYFLAGNNVLYALDASNGKQLWLYSRADPSAISVRAGATPTVKSGVVYAGFSDGYVVALNSKSGSVRWEKQLNKNKRFTDVDSSPVLDGDVMYVSGFDNALYSLKIQTGDVLWRFDKGGYTPVTLKGDRLYYATTQGEVVSLDKNSGKLIWTFELKDGVATQPIFYKGLVTFGESAGMLRFLNAQTGQQVAYFDPGRGLLAAPTVDENLGQVFFMSNEANLYALETKWLAKKVLMPWLVGL